MIENISLNIYQAINWSIIYILLLLSHSVVSDSLLSHGLQHSKLPCPSPTPGACSNSCPSSRWCHPTISSSNIPFSSCLQFQWVSSLHQVAKVLDLQNQSFLKEFSGLISFRIDHLAVQGTLKCLLQRHSLKASILCSSAFFMAQHSHLYMTTGKTIVLSEWTFVGKVKSLLFNMLSSWS